MRPGPSEATEPESIWSSPSGRLPLRPSDWIARGRVSWANLDQPSSLPASLSLSESLSSSSLDRSSISSLSAASVCGRPGAATDARCSAINSKISDGVFDGSREGQCQVCDSAVDERHGGGSRETELTLLDGRVILTEQVRRQRGLLVQVGDRDFRHWQARGRPGRAQGHAE